MDDGIVGCLLIIGLAALLAFMVSMAATCGADVGRSLAEEDKAPCYDKPRTYEVQDGGY